jgi:hypothetical protein
MFKIKATPEFTVPVDFGGEDGTLIMICKRKKQTERAEAYDRLTAEIDAIGEGSTKEKTQAAIQAQANFLMEFVTGWKDADAEFSRDQLVALLDERDGTFQRILDAYKTAGEEAAAKN